jgi:hypothetical protein
MCKKNWLGITKHNWSNWEKIEQGEVSRINAFWMTERTIKNYYIYKRVCNGCGLPQFKEFKD